jgi:hypothetical protein
VSAGGGTVGVGAVLGSAGARTTSSRAAWPALSSALPVAAGLAELSGAGCDVGAAGDGEVLDELAGGEGVTVSGGGDEDVGFVLGGTDVDGLVGGVLWDGGFVQLGDTDGLGAPCLPIGGGPPPM